MPMVLRALPFRHQHLNALPDQFVSRVSEQGFGLGVNLNNHAMLVDGNNGVRDGLESRRRQQGLGHNLLVGLHAFSNEMKRGCSAPIESSAYYIRNSP